MKTLFNLKYGLLPENPILLIVFLPLFLSSQEQWESHVVKSEDVGWQLAVNLPSHGTNYYISGQLEMNGYSHVDIINGYLCYYHPESGYDSLALPKDFYTHHYNVIPNPNGSYYFLDATKRTLFQSTNPYSF